MATIDTRATIDQMIAANGAVYDDEPPVIKIVEYVNAWGKTTWGVVWANDPLRDRYEIETEYVRTPRVIWRRNP